MSRRNQALLVLLPIMTAMLWIPQIPLARAGGGLALDSSSSGSCIGITQCTTYASNLDTAGTNDLVILQVLLNNTGTVTAVTSNQGLTWTQRAEVLNGLGGRESEWYAVASRIVSNPSISVTDSIPKIRVGIEIFGIAGYDTASPFDHTISGPTVATGSSTNIAASISANDAYDMLIGLEYGGKGPSFTPGSGFTGICLNDPSCSVAGIDPAASEYQIAPAAQSNSIVSMTQTGASNWGFIIDSIESAIPFVDSVSPGTGAVGSVISVEGTALSGALSVEFCGMFLPGFTVVNDTSMTIIAPRLSSPPSTQTCDIVVSNGSGASLSSASDQFSFLPTIASIEPTSGSYGTVLRITGSSFIGATSLTICGIAILQPRFSVSNDTEIMTTVPQTMLATSTRCDVVVTNFNGKSPTSGGAAFTYVPQGGSQGTGPNTTNAPTLTRVIYIAAASVAAIALIVGSQVVHRRGSEEKKDQELRSHGEASAIASRKTRTKQAPQPLVTLSRAIH